MARINKIYEKNEKKLIISQFLPDEIRDDEEDYITIRRLSHSDKLKLQLLATDTFDGQTQKNIFQKAKEKGLTMEDIDNMPDVDKAMFFMECKLENKDKEKIGNMTIEYEKIIFNNGVDPKKHSFYNIKIVKDKEIKEPIELDYDFLDKLGNEKLIKFILENIKDFSKGFQLGK